MKKILVILLCFVIQLSAFSSLVNAQTSTDILGFPVQDMDNAPANIGIRSTSVWVEEPVVKVGNKIKIHYRFDDEPHTVKITVYLKGTWISDLYDSSNDLSNVFEYSPMDEGTYTFIVKPIDAPQYGGQTSVTVYKDRVIFIPGIMGTDLYVDNVKAWIPETNIHVTENIRKLEMTGTGVSKNIVVPGDPVDDFYKSISTYLEKQNYHVVNFGYDWRLDISENAKKLKQVIDKEHSASPYSEVYIVAHSMGGLVATEYIKEGNASSIDKLITIGTPYLGSPKSVYMFETGNAAKRFQNVVINDAILSIIPNIISAYQLLPSENYFTYNQTRYLTIEELNNTSSWKKSSNYKRTELTSYSDTMDFFKKKRNWANGTMLTRAGNFHKELNILSSLKLVDSYFIIGDQIATPGEVIVPLYRNNAVSEISSIQGDGTVPLISANIAAKINPDKVYYIKEEHTKLPGNESVQQQIGNILKNKPEQLAPNIRKTSKKIKSLRLKVECPVDVHVYDSQGNHAGALNNDSYENNIPYGEYYTDGENKFVLLEDANYTVKLQGTGYGEMIYSLIWTDENDIEEKTLRFDGVEVTPNSIFTSEISKDGIIELKVDSNGDGTIDRILPPSVELDKDSTLDKTIPTISSRIDGVKGVNEWYGVGVYYNLIGQDNQSGVYKTYYDLNKSDFQEYTKPIPLPNTGIYNFKSFVRDKNRNDSEVLLETVKVDTTLPTKPSMTIEPLKWTNQFVKVTLSGSIDIDSGFQKYQFKIGVNGEWKDYIAPIIIDYEGLHNVYARAVDNVFNLSEEVSGEAKVDKTRPSTPGGFKILLYNYNQIKISWLPSTDNVEVTGYDIFLDSVFVGSTTETEFTFNNLVSNRSYKFTIVARDEATNSSLDGIFVVRTPKSLVGTGSNHTLQVKPDGKVWVWGDNYYGQLGDGTTTSKTTAVEVPELTDVLSVAAGMYHSLALKSDGTVWAWGYNYYGQLGNGVTGMINSVPVQVKNLSGIIGIAANGNTSYALKNDGTVWSWGINDKGQIGDGSSTARNMPVKTNNVSGVSELAAGDGYVYALRVDGTVYGWGRTINNIIPGVSSDYPGYITQAKLITGLMDITSIAVNNGFNYGLALKKDGSVLVWGGSTSDIRPVSGLNRIKSIAGGDSNYAIAEDGSVWNWTSGTPTQVVGLKEINAIAVGKSYVVASKADESVYAWGSVNNFGQLGDGTTVAHTTPALVQVNSAPKVKLTYPLGSQEVPEESNVSNPVIRWTQEDAALTNFALYQVQVLNADGTVVVDSGEVKQPLSANVNAWTVTEPLPSGQTFQVRVRVNDEHLWSEWSSVGWVRYSEVSSLRSMQHQMTAEASKKAISVGEETTITFTVYGLDNSVDTNFSGLRKLELTGYQVLSEDSPGEIGNIYLSKLGGTIVDIEFDKGLATIPLTLLINGNHILTFRLVGTDLVGLVEINVLLDEEQSEVGEPVREQSKETNDAGVDDANIFPNPDQDIMRDNISDEEIIVDALLGRFKMDSDKFQTYIITHANIKHYL